MTQAELRQLYNNMEEGSVDATTDAIASAMQAKKDAKKNAFPNFTPLTKTGTNTEDSQTKEKAATNTPR